MSEEKDALEVAKRIIQWNLDGRYIESLDRPTKLEGVILSQALISTQARLDEANKEILSMTETWNMMCKIGEDTLVEKLHLQSKLGEAVGALEEIEACLFDANVSPGGSHKIARQALEKIKEVKP